MTPHRRAGFLPPEGRPAAPWGGPAAGQAGRGRRQRGFTYLAVLFLVAITAAGLAALGQSWSTAAQRERERELEFRGNAIAAAIRSYQRAGVTPMPQLPRSLDDLVLDRRGPKPLYHLRQRYADPFTGAPDWELIPDVADPSRFNAVRSRADRPLLRERGADGVSLRKVSDWVFAAPPLDARPGKPATPVPSPAPPASAPP